MSAAVFDVVIVGAGVSGAWCAWRLTDPSAGSGRHGRVGLFELSDRVGGRLLSVRLPGLPDVACELGGMRYMSTQRIVKRLVENELKLKTISAPVDEADNIAYLRRRWLRRRELTDPEKIPYELSVDERSKDPTTLLGDAINEMAPEAKGSETRDDLRRAVQKARYNRRPLWQQGFWNILAREMSTEAYRFTQEAGGYDTTQLNWNAADTVVLNADFGPRVKYSRIEDGFDEVPRQLVRRFESQRGELHLEHRLLSLALDTLDNGQPCVVLAFDVKGRGKRKIRARSVILAMPRRSLELLDATGPVLGHRPFRRQLTQVTPIPLFKCFVAYHEPWWERAGVASGRSVTDLPLRQVYYWHTAPGNCSVLLATYDDTLNVAFWRGLAADRKRYRLKLDQVPEAMRISIRASVKTQADDRWKHWKAPSALVTEVHRQLVEMHDIPPGPPLPRPPRPYAAVYRDWTEDPFGGGVHFWNIGLKSWVEVPNMVHPVPAVPVYVCGEAYSESQGWVEGALQTAELVCTKHLGLRPISFPKR
jgi:monoamine oxidase